MVTEETVWVNKIKRISRIIPRFLTGVVMADRTEHRERL